VRGAFDPPARDTAESYAELPQAARLHALVDASSVLVRPPWRTAAIGRQPRRSRIDLHRVWAAPSPLRFLAPESAFVRVSNRHAAATQNLRDARGVEGCMATDREMGDEVIADEPACATRAGGANETAARRLAESVDAALAELRRDPLDDRCVHHARRALKKARAALRLLRPAWGDARYRIENQALRDAGRCLSPLRDARAVFDAFEALSQRIDADEDLGRALARLRGLLGLDLRVARRLMRRPSEPLERCIALLEAHRMRHRLAEAGRVDRSAPHTDTPGAALRRLYRKARRQLDRADRSHAKGQDALHEWRKQVKYLVNAVEELRQHLGPRADKLTERADAIADDLGAEHDLAVLAGRIAATGSGAVAALDEPGVTALGRLIDRRRRKLRRRAVAMGRRVFRRKPRRFLKRLLDDAPADRSRTAH
jgi:CHAD domain-containing protein